MQRCPVILVDAFTATPLAGNPCFVLLGAADLTARQMQALAVEFNQVETAFVTDVSGDRVKARYFTPSFEIPFAGHPTVAVFCALVAAGRIGIDRPADFRLELPTLEIPVRVSRTESGRTRVEMRQPAPRFLATHDPGPVCATLGIRPEDLLEGVPVQTVSTGTPFLMVPLRREAMLSRLTFEIDRGRALKARGDFTAFHVFAVGGRAGTAVPHTVARNFDVPPDIVEDPYTGSATGCMAAYLAHHALLRGPFTAHQGVHIGRPGLGTVEALMDGDEIRGVHLSGTGVPVLSGELHPQPAPPGDHGSRAA